jgi:predicted phosphodiesterase
MRIHALSDIHLECGDWSREPDVRTIDADVTVLAGDIGVGLQGVEWAIKAFDRPTIYICGNHEFYGGVPMPDLNAQLRARCKGTHVHFLENESVVIEGVRFLGCSLWTDFQLRGQDEASTNKAMRYAGEYMTDYQVITVGTQASDKSGPFKRLRAEMLTPQYTQDFHWASAAWLQAALSQPFAGTTVVVTHHAPSARSLSKEKEATLIGAAYASNLEHLLGAARSALWIHGHVHEPRDYQISGTRIICNPRGYLPSHRVMEFDPALVVTV